MNDSLWPLLGSFSFVVIVGLYIWTALALATVFGKAGEHAGKAWVPVYNAFVVLRLGGFSGWFVLLAFVPVVNLAFLVIWIVACHRITLDFGHGGGMTVLAALAFPVWASVLGWGSARYLGRGVPRSDRSGGPEPANDDGWASGPRRSGASVSGAATPRYTASGPSVFGVHGPAGGPGLPPRPPVPGAFPPVLPQADGPDGAFPAPEHARSHPPNVAPPPLWGTVPMRPSVDLERDSLGRAPFTQTTPTLGTRAPSEEAPAGPVSAVAAEPAGTVEEADAAARTPASAPPWAPPAVAPAAAPAEARATRLPSSPDADAHYDTADEVSAVAGAPVRGAPRSARTSVSAQHAAHEIPDEPPLDETIIGTRRRAAWTLVPPLGAPLPLTGETVILGRRPGFDIEHPSAQLIPVADETRTISKTHARLELREEGWFIVDLDSTNGVVLIARDGAEREITPGTAERLTHRFLLGDAELQVRREGE